MILEHLEQMTLDFFQLQLQMQHLARPKPYNPQGRQRLVESPTDNHQFHEQNHDHPALLKTVNRIGKPTSSVASA